jgi:hypothetical protein
MLKVTPSFDAGRGVRPATFDYRQEEKTKDPLQISSRPGKMIIHCKI